MDFCQNCGARLTPDADFCPVCGARCARPVASLRPTVPPASSAQPAHPEAPRPVPPQSGPEASGSAAPGPQPGTGPRYSSPAPESAGVPSVWWYFGMLLLFAVPVVGLVAMLCFSLLPGCSDQQRNLARACLLLALILALAVLVGIFLFSLLLGSMQNVMLYFYYGFY